MGWIGECKNDNDCPYKQYCYNVSGRCVATLNCSNYNRESSQIAAREPSQCGPCMKGYVSEVLASGDGEMSVCKNTENQVGSSAMSDVYKIIPVIVAVAIIFSMVCHRFYKRYRVQRRSSRSNNADIAPEVAPDNANAIAVASVPPEEEKLFIRFGETKYCVPHNNNKVIRETNQYQTGVPFTPHRRPVNAYTLTNNNTDNNNSNSNNNPLSGEVAINVPEDQHYRNIETSQTDPSNDDELPNHNDADGDTIDSASEPTNKGEKIKSSLIINQMVHQNIIINLNGEEY